MDSADDKLRALYQRLNDEDQASLLAFAEFLAMRSGAAPTDSVASPVRTT